MLKHLTVKQHLDMAIKQWELVADKGISKYEALWEMGIKSEEMPKQGCYLCEVFNKSVQDTLCNLCPLATDDEATCEALGTPYIRYKLALQNGEITTGAAQEIVDLIKAGKKRMNYG